MSELFSKADIDFKPLIEYVGWFLDEKSNGFDIIQLPPIQRNAVWNSQQVERLWDSILRGFPIGSFLLSPRKEGSTSRSIFSNDQKPSKSSGFFLLDGQQRTRAMLLGFRPTENSRLWIDLDPNLAFGNPEFNDRNFLFRIITTYQPWGMSDRNPADKISENEKYNARKELYENSVRYDYKVLIDTQEGNNQEKYSWPVKSTLPVPFDKLVNLCGGTTGIFIEPAWEKILELVPDRFKREAIPECPEHVFLITKALRNLLDVSEAGNKFRAVAFLKQNDFGNTIINSNEDQDSVEVLFRRVNSGGTLLAGEEMTYSLLKASWDESYDLVSKIVNDEHIGYLFPATGIIMAATRIARYNLKKNDEVNPGVPNFRKWIGEKDDNGNAVFLTAMKNLLKGESGNSKFHLILRRFIKLAIHRESEDLKDIGMPRKLLLSIKPAIIHPVLIWLHENSESNDERNRSAILRYLIYSLIGVSDHNRMSKTAVELLIENPNVFPDVEIYNCCVRDEIADEMPDNVNFGLPFNSFADGGLRPSLELVGSEDDKYKDFRNAFWHKKELLLWFQRAYNATWFAGYNPMSDDSYDTPYDYDHIVPYSHLVTSGGSPNIYSEDPELNQRFFRSRHLYINSIGNFRVWPSWANRSDSNVCHTSKMRMECLEHEIDEVGIELSFKSNREFISSSMINIEDFEIWQEAGGKPRHWNESRRKCWQQAVENRVKFLFCIFHDSFDFSKWTSSN